jgi:Bacterial Ig-like domain (group 1)
MIRRVVANLGLVLLTLLFVSCGGGGGGAGGGAPAGSPNERTDDTGRLTLSVDKTTINFGETVSFAVTVRDRNLRSLSGQSVDITVGSALTVNDPVLVTGPDGTATGTITGAFPGSASLRATAQVMDGDTPVTLSTFIGIVVVAPIGVVGPNTPTPLPGQATRTPLPAALVHTIVMETKPFSVSASLGGSVTVQALAFDANNQPINGVEMLFDFTPKQGVLRPATAVTQEIDGQNGVAQTTITYDPNTATPGEVTVTAFAAGVTGSVRFNIVSGSSSKPVATVLLQTSTNSIGTLSGGQTTLTAVVFDADNNPINDVNVLFLTSVGQVIPLTATTGTNGSQKGQAQATLTIPTGTPVLRDATGLIQPYTILARAGGVTGSVQLYVVDGSGTGQSGGPTGAPGQPASITLFASPIRVRARGAGGQELATVAATVFDNNGNRLEDVESGPDQRSVKVTFSVVQPSATGAALLPNNDGTFTDPTDAAGNAQMQLRAGPGLGTVNVRAEVPTDIGVPELTEPCQSSDNAGKSCIVAQKPLVTVTAGNPGRVNLVINDVYIDLNDGARLTTLSAIITDAQGNIVEDSTPVFFEILVDPNDPTDPARQLAIQGFSATNQAPPCDVSQFSAQTGLPVTPEPGDAITCLKFPPNLAGTRVQVRAESQGVEVTDTVTLPGTVANIRLSGQPSSVVVTDTESATILLSALVYDVEGAGVRNVQLRFFSDVGTFDDGPFALTDADGVAQVPLTIPAGTPAGTVTIQAVGGGIRLVTTTVDVTNQGATGPAGTPQSIGFVSANPPTIGVRGSGFPEQAVVSFKVIDSLGNPLSGVNVHFGISGLGGETITPNATTTDSNGIARVAINSGTRAAPLRITASVSRNNDGTIDLVTQSDAVSVVGAPPTFNRFSLAAQSLNIAGRVSFGLQDTISAFLNDRFGNPVPPGTAVSFITNGASIVSPQPTDASGRASATLLSEGKIEGLPPSGIVTVLATARGEEPFVDTNGNGVYDIGEPYTPIPEPFIDVNGNGRYDPDNPYEMFIDVNGNGVWDEDQSLGQWTDNALIFATFDVTLSGHTLLQLTPSSFSIPDGGSQTFTLFVGDANQNPLTAGSTISLSLSPSPSDGQIADILPTIVLPDAESFNAIVPGLNQFVFRVVDNNPGKRTSAQPVTVNVNVGSDGNGNASISAAGVLEAPATPVPTSTPTATLTPTVTSTATLTPTLTSTPTPTVTPTNTVTPTVTNTPVPRAISFISATPTSIGVTGSGLPLQATLTFRVTNAQAQPIAGIPVQFGLTSTSSLGGASVDPSQAISDSDGLVQVVLTSGNRATTVRVTATVVGSATVTTQSTAVNILGGEPAANRFSIAPQFRNVAGRVTFGLQDVVTAFVNDRFGNAVPEGTAVTFQSDFASLVDVGPTDAQGRASATLLSEGQSPPDGIVTLLAYTRGEKTFTDTNGNGVWDVGEPVQPLPEPFFDENGNGIHDANEPFIDVNGNGVWDADQDPVGQFSNEVLVFDTTRVTFSAGTILTLEPNGFIIPDGGSQSFTVTLADGNNNPLVSGTTVNITITGGVTLLGPSTITIPDSQTFGATVDGLNRFSFSVVDSQPGMGATAEPISVGVTVTSPPSETAPGGNGSTSAFSSGTLQAAPTPVPTATPTATPPPTATPTPQPPAIAPTQIGLLAGTGAPPSTCNGAAQTFVVTGGSPPFNVFVGGGCVSAASVPASGGSFVFTAGNTLGDFIITVTDALGRTASAGVSIQGPPTPTNTVAPTQTSTPPPTATPT